MSGELYFSEIFSAETGLDRPRVRTIQWMCGESDVGQPMQPGTGDGLPTQLVGVLAVTEVVVSVAVPAEK